MREEVATKMLHQILALLHSLGPKLLALCAAYVTMQLVLAYFRRRHRHRTFIRMQVPGPEPHLISGHLYETRRQAYVKFAHKMHQKYGKTVGYFLGGDPYLMTKDLELIKHVFVSKSRIFYDRMHFYLNVDPVPDNLICQRGDRWRYMRKLLTPAFSNGKVRTNQFYRDTQQTVDKLRSQLEANLSAGLREVFVEDSYDRMAAVALDVIVKTAFHMNDMISFEGPLYSQKGCCGSSKEAPIMGSKPDMFLNTVKRACRLGFNPLVELIFCFPFLDRPLTFLCNQLYFGGIIKLLFDRLEYLVRRNNVTSSSRDKNETEDGTQQHNPLQRRRIIDNLIEVLRERKITKSEFRGNAFVIVFAGFETTANALTFTLWLLAKHQEVQVKLRKDISMKLMAVTEYSASLSRDELLDAELGELSTGCEYLEMVINESLRLYPPVPALSCRQASEDYQLSNGMVIEKGVNVIPSVFSIHRDKSIWGQDANEFRPERFEMLDLSQLNSAMFMPFGLGPRNCVGKGVAMHEMKIVLGRLIQHYSIEFQPGRTPSKLKLCSPINITITNSEKIGLNFVKLAT